MNKLDTKNLAVKKSRNGKGIFAKHGVKTKETLFEITGDFITCDVDEDIPEKVRDNAIRFDAEKYIRADGKIADYINHSCEPNSYLQKKQSKLFLVACADIQKGQEIVMDYSLNLGSDDVWQMSCNCGTKNCRGVVRQFKKLPKKLREKYVELKMVPKYIL